ncbi:MAG: hypothetical protein M3Q27_09340, partial [Actinomycetota bacterium]|nr:hypothetical protein [Actinomycetota bacterium]
MSRRPRPDAAAAAERRLRTVLAAAATPVEPRSAVGSSPETSRQGLAADLEPGPAPGWLPAPPSEPPPGVAAAQPEDRVAEDAIGASSTASAGGSGRTVGRRGRARSWWHDVSDFVAVRLSPGAVGA